MSNVIFLVWARLPNADVSGNAYNLINADIKRFPYRVQGASVRLSNRFVKYVTQSLLRPAAQKRRQFTQRIPPFLELYVAEQ